MTPEERFERIESILHAASLQDKEIVRKFDERMDRLDREHEKAMQRMADAEAKSDRDHEKAVRRLAESEAKAEEKWRRHDAKMRRWDERLQVAEQKADERMAKFDKRLEATRQLVEQGMKLVMEMRRQQIADRAEVRRMQKNWDAYFASLRHPRNGNGRH